MDTPVIVVVVVVVVDTEQILVLHSPVLRFLRHMFLMHMKWTFLTTITMLHLSPPPPSHRRRRRRRRHFIVREHHLPNVVVINKSLPINL
jgi:hypothetical protein